MALIAAATALRPVVGQVAIEVVSTARTTVRDGWCTVAVPVAKVEGGVLRGRLRSKGWPVVVGRRLGSHSVLIHVHCSRVRPGQRISDTVEWEDTAARDEFERLSWAAVADLVPRLRVHTAAGVLVLPRSAWEREVVHEDDAERVTRVQARLRTADGSSTPLFWRAWLYEYRGEATARWDVQLVHSDSTSEVLEFGVERVELATETPHVVDGGWHLGASKVVPVKEPRPHWRTRLLDAVVLADGVRPTWTGLSFQPPPQDADPQEAEVRAAVESMRAAVEGPLVGCAAVGVWDGHWLALGRTPVVPAGAASPWASGARAHKEWREWSDARSADYWRDRYRAMARQPGQTGAQPNHGIVRGGEVVSTGCPLPLLSFSDRITAHLRPTAYYQQNLELVSAGGGWRTWQGRTFVRDEFREALGKKVDAAGQIPRPDTRGWLAPDEQHYGHLDLCAYYGLTGRMWAGQCLRELTEVWLAAFHELAGRGIGRAWLDLVAIHRLTGDPRIPAHMVAVYDEQMAGWAAKIRGPIKAWPRFRDPRALRSTDGTPVDCAVVWQIGLMVPGLQAATRITDHEGIEEALTLNVGALVRCGWFRTPDGRWLDVDYWVFRNGAPTTPADYGRDGNVPGRTHRTGWFGDWIAHATLLGTVRLEGAQRQRARAIARNRYGAGPKDWVASQWFLPVEPR